MNIQCISSKRMCSACTLWMCARSKRGSVGVYLLCRRCCRVCVSGALLQLRSLWFCTLQLSHCCGVHSSSSSVVVLASFFSCYFVVCICGKLGFFYKKEFLACLRGSFSCSAASSIQLEVIPVPRILVAVVRQVFFSWSVVWVRQISHWKFLGPESCFFLTQGECSFLWRKKERKDGFVPGEGERGSDKGATTVGRLTTLLSWSIKTRWRNNELARSRRGGDDRNDGTVRGFGGFIGLSDGSPVACSSARASARSCGASNQSRIHHRPRHSICHVVHGACVDVHYPSSWCYPLLSFLGRWCRHFEETLGTYLIDSELPYPSWLSASLSILTTFCSPPLAALIQAHEIFSVKISLLL